MLTGYLGVLERGGCLSLTEFLALVSGGQRLICCRRLSMIALHNILDSLPRSIERPMLRLARLSPRPSQKQDAVADEHVLGVGGFKRDSVHLSPYA